MSDQAAADILGLTAQIVSAHVSKNSIGPDALPSLIQSGVPAKSGRPQAAVLEDVCEMVASWMHAVIDPSTAAASRADGGSAPAARNGPPS